MPRRRTYQVPGGVSIDRIDELLAPREEPKRSPNRSPVSIVRRLIYPEAPTVSNMMEALGGLALMYFGQGLLTLPHARVELPPSGNVGIHVMPWRFIDSARARFPHLDAMGTDELAHELIAASTLDMGEQERRHKRTVRIRVDRTAERIVIVSRSPRFGGDRLRAHQALHRLAGISQEPPLQQPDVVVATFHNLGATDPDTAQVFTECVTDRIPPETTLVFGPPEVLPEAPVILNAAFLRQAGQGT